MERLLRACNKLNVTGSPYYSSVNGIGGVSSSSILISCNIITASRFNNFRVNVH